MAKAVEPNKVGFFQMVWACSGRTHCTMFSRFKRRTLTENSTDAAPLRIPNSAPIDIDQGDTLCRGKRICELIVVLGNECLYSVIIIFYLI